jgi:hypothetical protein
MWNSLIQLACHTDQLHELSESSLKFITQLWGWDERYQEFKKIILK